jgi:hypothetical protein
MFFDPGTKTETKADPLSLDSLIAWLEKKPADARYNECQAHVCMLAQWLQSIDPASRPAPKPEPDFIGSSFLYVVGDQRIDLRQFTMVALDNPHTFGGALYRAHKLRGES